MDFVIQIGIALVSWLAIMFVSTNLIGIWIGGFATNGELKEVAASNEVIASELRKSQRSQLAFATVLILAFLGALYYFWNIGLVAAALMLMASRAPDVIWEMSAGKRLTLDDARKPRFAILATLLSWASLPVVWYSTSQM